MRQILTFPDKALHIQPFDGLSNGNRLHVVIAQEGDWLGLEEVVTLMEYLNRWMKEQTEEEK